MLGLKGGKSGMGRLLGGGALLNAGPAHRLAGGGEGPFSSLDGRGLPSRDKGGEEWDLSTRFS